jgi:hypothetical protein
LQGRDLSDLMSRHFTPILITVALAFSLLGGLIGASRSNQYSANASVTLGTSTQQVFADGFGAERENVEEYVASQIEVLGSLEVARRAEALLQGGPYTPSVDEIQASTEVGAVGLGTEIGVTYGAESADDAVAGANAVIEGYRELMQQRWADVHAAAIESVTGTLEAAEAETQELLDETRAAPGGEETDLTSEMLEIIAELGEIDATIVDGATLESLEALDIRRGLLATQVDAFETVLAEQQEASRLSAASARLDASLVREAHLRDRLIELEVDSRMDGDGILFATPAESAVAGAAGWLLSGIAGLVLGAFVVLGLAYWLHRDVTRIESPADARRLLGYPLLGVIYPSGSRQSGGFASPSLHSSPEVLAGIRSRASGPEAQVLGLVGVDDDSMRTTTAVGLATAFADDGMSVLVVDGNLDLTADRDGLATAKGLADFASGMPLDTVIEPRQTASGSRFHVLGAGRPEVIDTLQTADLRAALRGVAGSYDAVIVDLPFSSLRGLTSDGFSELSCLLVVEHESRVKPVKGLLRDFEETDLEPVGFVYAFNGVTDSVPVGSGPS